MSSPAHLLWEKVFQKVTDEGNLTSNAELVGYKIAKMDANHEEFVLQIACADDIWIVVAINNFLDHVYWYEYIPV